MEDQLLPDELQPARGCGQAEVEDEEVWRRDLDCQTSRFNCQKNYEKNELIVKHVDCQTSRGLLWKRDQTSDPSKIMIMIFCDATISIDAEEHTSFNCCLVSCQTRWSLHCYLDLCLTNNPYASPLSSTFWFERPKLRYVLKTVFPYNASRFHVLP